jgi:MYXO-CTERM domain-containing protein
MEPETASLEGLEAGESFADPAGSPRFTVEAIDDTKATVRVEFAGGGQGAPVCGDGTFLEGTGVGPESCAAEPSIPDVTPPPGPPPPTVGPGGAPPGSPGTIVTTDPMTTACACRTGGRSGGPPAAGLLLLLVALGALGRRRARLPPGARRS